MKMKKVTLALFITLGLFMAFCIGYKSGVSDVLDSQVVTSNTHEQGFYTVFYNNEVYTYWYE